jgi:hypothetical protein
MRLLETLEHVANLHIQQIEHLFDKAKDSTRDFDFTEPRENRPAKAETTRI